MILPRWVYPLDRIGQHEREVKDMSLINLTYPTLLDLFRNKYIVSGRTESAAFLMWYLENYYRLDEEEAVACVCDKRGDKGVDGIFVNDDEETITVFQSQISQSDDRTIGDSSLRTFSGTLTQFKDKASIDALIGNGNSMVGALAKRLDLTSKIATHQLRGEFVSNVDIDTNGESFLKTSPMITFVGSKALLECYISDKRNTPIGATVYFDTTGVRVSEYTVDSSLRAIIVPIKSTDLIKLQGISNQSLFAYNVRGPLGRTKVNKDIVSSIKDQTSHKLFPLFHNGITIVAKNVIEKKDSISIDEYFVVNGCQSLTALYDNKDKLTDDLRILVKFIQADPSSKMTEDITDRSNNQNAVKPRDFMANNTVQIRLQNEFSQNYAKVYWFEIKRGEAPQQGQVISNEDAGLLLMAFDLKEPWATHRKYQVFEEKHADIFARPEVTADRIVLLQVINDSIIRGLQGINNKLFAKYSLTKYLLLYVIRFMLENDPLDSLLTKPEGFVREKYSREKFSKLMDSIVNNLVIDLNAEIDDLPTDWDYRDKLRSDVWINDLRKKLVAQHLKDISRRKSESLKDQWAKL
ncbi:MAG: AIPR family protein [Dehalococcoidia bacterium]|jgi:hypothetical protein